MNAIRVSSVDGYQGEENDIVLLSLVRNNKNHSIGFLRSSNRVCVALSRARLGFYIVGNLDLFAQVSSLWRNVQSYLRKLKALGELNFYILFCIKLNFCSHIDNILHIYVGPKLMLKCQKHGTCLGYVSNSLDFESLASCESMCNFAMNKLSCEQSSNEVYYTINGSHSNVKRSYPYEK